ncbi:hypothetical protein H8K35_06510 [Undibacterium sp. LX40W]|uniref:Uncharacterized protein n=1 Tax=Undibacterium nitidum TaxID=2762298 RepID=A0A923KR87_9BURK|nr:MULTISPECIES: hypothetical protein [Undibacterium]MBC3879961.1 hypothetical protein [Undibacterium nitidum]MBC3891303.1 hypothetical protein [Undibacterium sp. LX40W]
MTTTKNNGSERLAQYYTQLQNLVKDKLAVPDLLSFADIGALRDKVKSIEVISKKVYQLPFCEKSSPRFEKFVLSLARAQNESVLIWTELSNEFGPAKLKSLLDVDFDFPFGTLPEGIVVIVNQSGSGKILLDWEVDPDEGQMLTLEVLGDKWTNIEF